MALKKLSYKTECVLNIILNNLLKEGRRIEGKLWVKIPQKHLAKILKCTSDCISHHICKMVNECVLFRDQLGAKDHDHTNYYSINSAVLEDSNLMSFFNASIKKKIRTIYNINTNKSLINHNKSITRDCEVDIVSDIADMPKKASANPPVASEQAKEKCSAESKPTIAQDMVRIWNEELNRNDRLSKPLSKYLVASYQRKFGSLLEKWTNYVCGLKRSAYVMGKLLKRLGGKLLNWALSFKVINRIFAGGFGVTLGEALGVKYEQQASTTVVFAAEKHINSLTESEACKAIRREVLETYGEDAYLSWFRRVTLEESGNEILLKGLSFITSNVKLRYLHSNDSVIDAGEKYVPDDIVDESEIFQSELISHGYLGSAKVRSALFGGM